MNSHLKDVGVEYGTDWVVKHKVSAMKDLDPVAWRCAESEWESQEEDEGTTISFDHGTTTELMKLKASSING